MCVDTLRQAAPLRALRAERLVENNMRLVYVLVWKVCRIGNRAQDWPDAVAAGVLALCRAARAYSEHYDLEFSHIANRAVCNELERFKAARRRSGLVGLGDPHDHPGRIEPTTTHASAVGSRQDFSRTVTDDREAPEWDTEDARAALKHCRDDRHRQIVRRAVMDGEAQRTVGADLGISHARVGQIVQTSLVAMRRGLTGRDGT